MRKVDRASSPAASAAGIAGDGDGIPSSAVTMGPGQKPFASYFGGKGAAGSAERIVRVFPPHSVYVEAFLGGGAVLRRKGPALCSIGIDADARVCAAWRAASWPGLSVVHGDALDWLARAELPSDALVYADPPYLHEVRSSRHRYRCEISAADHARLLGVLDALPCSVVISGYWSAMYAERLGHWRSDSWDAMTRGGVRREWIWYRVSGGARYGVEPRFVGRDFRERERIKRKCARWRRMLMDMPAGERSAVLAELVSAYAAMPPAGSSRTTMAAALAICGDEGLKTARRTCP